MGPGRRHAAAVTDMIPGMLLLAAAATALFFAYLCVRDGRLPNRGWVVDRATKPLLYWVFVSMYLLLAAGLFWGGGAAVIACWLCSAASLGQAEARPRAWVFVQMELAWRRSILGLTTIEIGGRNCSLILVRQTQRRPPCAGA